MSNRLPMKKSKWINLKAVTAGFFWKAGKNGYRVEALFFNGLTGFISFINISVVVAGAVLISYNRLHLTELITFFVIYKHFGGPGKKRLVNFTQNLQNGVAGFERFMEIMAVEPDITDAKDAAVLGSVKGKVEFVNVGFQYASDSNYVFSNINITANPGEYVALAGSSGVGKTTLCSLIPRFFYETSKVLLKLTVRISKL